MYYQVGSGFAEFHCDDSIEFDLLINPSRHSPARRFKVKVLMEKHSWGVLSVVLCSSICLISSLGFVLLPVAVSKQLFLNKAFTNHHHPLLQAIG